MESFKVLDVYKRQLYLVINISVEYVLRHIVIKAAVVIVNFPTDKGIVRFEQSLYHQKIFFLCQVINFFYQFFSRCV